MYSYCYKSSKSTASSSYFRYSYFVPSTLYYTVHVFILLQEQYVNSKQPILKVFILQSFYIVFILLQEQYVNSKQLILQVFILHSLYIVLHMYSYCYKSSTSTASSSYSRYSYFILENIFYKVLKLLANSKNPWNNPLHQPYIVLVLIFSSLLTVWVSFAKNLNLLVQKRKKG